MRIRSLQPRQCVRIFPAILFLYLFVLFNICGHLEAQGPPTRESSPAAELVDDLQPALKIFQGATERFRIKGELDLEIDGESQRINWELARWDEESFALKAEHPEYAVTIVRSPEKTAMILPKHQVVFLGAGEVDSEDRLTCDGFLERAISTGCELQPYTTLLLESDADTLATLVKNITSIRWSEDADTYVIDGQVSVSVAAEKAGQSIKAKGNGWKLTLNLSPELTEQSFDFDSPSWPGMTVKSIERAELERHLIRGLRRGLEVLLPSNQLRNPAEIPKRVPGGELRYVQGQRLVILQGSPEEIGTAHGKLLKTQAQRCIDSVLYGFGTVQTIVTGRWFPGELASAYKRLKPHIPPSHIAETRSLAIAMEQDPDVLEVLNVFPELFHCSGFAVFGSATIDGKLYHGRVLDYMTTIGLQDSATTFIVKVDGKIPFANVGYAGFTGSVSGMNAEGISLGEMGGRGEGQWDGVPMATLMRRGLEECDSLDKVIKLWSTSPRTCEYYYVFADGKTNDAVGVAATPQFIQFIKPGEGHELLGDGIVDTIALSAGQRLETLRRRITEKHGHIDQSIAIDLMSRPVAMQSNLHNVLFVPEDGIFFVANASHDRPAADCKYVRFDLYQMLESP